MTGNFPNLAKDLNLHIQEAEQTPSKKNPKKSVPSHLLVKLTKTNNKEKNLESSKREVICYLQEKNTLNGSGFLIRNHGGQK